MGSMMVCLMMKKKKKNNMINQIIERAEKRRAQWLTVPVRELPDPYTLQEVTLMGSYSMTKLSSRQRMIIKSESIQLTPYIIETPSAIARDYLKEKYKRGQRVSHLQAVTLMDGLRLSPNYAKPSKYDHGFYVDIKSAYWSIMTGAGWDVDYFPNKWLSAGAPPLDFPFQDHKIARNCLVSAGVPGKITRYTPRGVFDEISPGSPLANVSLYRLISDVLNSIGAAAVELGAIYVNTDGYIAPDANSAARIVQLINDWGLTARIKAEGSGSVLSSGAYKVGRDESQPWKLRKVKKFVSNLHAPKYAPWLQKNFTFWVRENT